MVVDIVAEARPPAVARPLEADRRRPLVAVTIVVEAVMVDRSVLSVF